MIKRLIFALWITTIPLPGVAEVIVHPDVRFETVSRQYLVSVFTMRTRVWPDGQPVRVFILPNSTPQHRQFAKQTLGLFPYQLTRIWDRQTFSGASQLPHTVKTAAEMIERVRITPGAVGYIMQPIEGEKGVKLLEVQ